MYRKSTIGIAVAGVLVSLLGGCQGGGGGPRVSGLYSLVSVQPGVGVTANGIAVATIAVEVRDVNDHPVPGLVVTFAASGSGNTIQQPGLSSADGQATGTLASTVAETKTIAVLVDPGPSQVILAQQPTVTFTSDPTAVSATLSTAIASPSSGLPANGITVTTITVTVRDDNGNGVPGQPVQFAATGAANAITQPAVTDANGVTSGTLASTAEGTKVVTVTVNPGANAVLLAQQPSVVFIGDQVQVSAAGSSVVAAPTSGLTANGIVTATITVTVRDVNNNAVAGQVVQFAASGSGNTITQPAAVTNGMGVATGLLRSTVAESKTVSAIVNPGPAQIVLAQQPAVGFVPGPVSASISTATAAPSAGVPANGTTIATITVTVRDAQGNPVPGQTVQLTASGSGNTVAQPSAVTNASGVATGTLRSTFAEAKTVTATVNPGAGQVVIVQLPLVTFVGDTGGISSANSSAVASPSGNVTANGSATSTITVTVRDANNNPVVGQVVQLSSTGTNHTIVQPAAVTNGSGVATGTIASTMAETKTVTATVNPGPGQVVIAQQPAVAFVPGAVSATVSSAVASPSAGLPANGTTVATITVTVRDAQGNGVAGQTVQLAATGSGNTLTQPGSTTNASGVATGTLASTAAETKTVTATVNPGAGQVVITQQPVVAFTADTGTISSANSAASASPSSNVLADGSASSTITVTVRDANNNPVAGQVVMLSSTGSGNTIVQPAAMTNGSGVATGTIASTTAETKTITATVNPGPGQVVVAQQPTVAFIVGAVSATVSTVTAAPSAGVPANGSTVATITVTVRDPQGNPIAGQTVQLAATGTGNTLTQPASTTNASGVATGTLAATVAESKTITVTVNPGASQVLLSQQPTVVFAGDTGGISSANSTASASPGSNVTADGSTLSTITVTVRDANNNPVVGQAVVLSATGTNHTIVQPVAVTNGSGVATGTIASTTAETKVVTATVNPGPAQVVVAQQPTVTFIPGSISAAVSSALASPASGLPANGTTFSTITVTVRDSNGNAIAGQTVQLAATGTGNSLTQPASTTNASGVATGTLAATVAETKTITATVNPGASQVVITQQPTVAFTADTGTISSANSSATASPSGNVLANGASSSTITVTVRDANNNPVAGQSVTLSSTGSTNTIVQPAAVTNASGVATGTIASTVAETKTITATVNPGPGQVVVAQQPTVAFIVGAVSATVSTATAAPSAGVPANGSTVATVTVTVRDPQGNPIAGQTVQLAATGTGNTLTQPASNTNASGVATGTLASTLAETKTITITVNPGAGQVVLSQQPTVVFAGDSGGISSANTSASASPGSNVLANGSTTSTITVTVRDANSNPVAGQVVQLSSTGTNHTIVQPAAVTNSSGIATGTIASTMAETKVVTATVNPGPAQVVVAQQPTVAFIPGSISAAISSAAASPSAGLPANGTTLSTITVTVRDQNGNGIAGQTVQLAATGTGNSLTQPASTTNASGVATCTLASTVAETKTITATVNPGASQVVISQQPTVAFTADTGTISSANSSASASPSGNVLANGVALSTITVTVRDANNNPVAGQAVTLSSTGSGNTIVQPAAVTNGSGVATGTIASTTAETKTITATVNPGPGQVVVAQQPTVTFIVGAVSATVSTATAAPSAGVPANGSTVATITVTVRDAQGNPIAGQTVQLAATGTGNTLTQPSSNTNASGVATGTLASTVAESKTITVTVNPGAGQVVLSQQPTVVFAGDSGGISSANSGASASPAANVTADGSTTSTITVTVRDANNNPVAGQVVQLSSTGTNHTIVQPAAVTNGSGVATGTIATTMAETKVVTATVNPGPGQVVVAVQPTVAFVPGAVSATIGGASASPSSGVPANGTTVSTISVTVRDSNGNAISGQTVQLASSGTGNTVTQPPGTTDGGGLTTGTLASTVAETKTITVTVNPGPGQVVLLQQPTVVFAGDPAGISSANSSASASPGSNVLADGVTVSTITVTIRDANSNPVAGQVVILSATGTSNTIVQPAAVTDGSGVATGTIASTTAETKTVTATVNPGPSQVVVAQQPTVAFVPGAVSATISTASASPSTAVAANGTAVSTITVTVRDAQGNAIVGQTVQLAATGSGNTLTQPASTTNGSGIATGTIASTTAETKTITVTVNPGASQVVLSQQPTVAFTGDPGSISAGNTTATASPSSNVLADGSTVSTITVTVRDSNGNAVAGQVVLLAATGTNNTLVQPAAITNASGVATGTIASTTAETKTITATVNPGPSQVAVTQQPTVAFVPGAVSSTVSTATTSPATGVAANGTTVSTITVTVRDGNGNAIAGQTVQLAATGTGNTLTQPGATTNASGVATGTIASTVAETKTVTATVNPGAGQVVLVQQPTVVFIGDAGSINAANSTASASPGSNVVANGTSGSTITVTVRDANNNLVSGQIVTFTATGTGNTLVQPATTTNASGVATGTLRSTVAETKTVTATINPGPAQVVVTQQPTVAFIGDASTISAANSSATALPATGVLANVSATSTITVTVRDANSNPVAGQTVQLTATGSGNTITQPASVTDSSGIATGTIAAAVAEVKTVTATVNPGGSPVAITQQPTVEFVAAGAEDGPLLYGEGSVAPVRFRSWGNTAAAWSTETSTPATSATVKWTVSEVTPVGWYGSAWSHRKKITIDRTKVSGSTPHQNFPVLISLTDANLQSRAQADGDDILFTSANGRTKLDHEIEQWDSGTGVLVAWVRVPSLGQAADTELWLYYGNAAATSQQNASGVWSNSYAAVWHLAGSYNGTASEVADSSGNAHHGQAGSAPARIAAKVGYGQDFEASAPNWIAVNHGGSLDFDGAAQQLTFSGWVKLESTGSAWKAILSKSASFDYEFSFRDTSPSDFAFRLNAGSLVTTSTLAAGSWHYVAGTWDHATMRAYFDGVADVTTTAKSDTVQDTSDGLGIGAAEGGSADPMDGVLDEIRMASTARSAGWILTEFNNQGSPATFHTAGSEEAWAGVSPEHVVAVLSDSGTAGVVNLLRYTGSAWNSDWSSNLIAQANADLRGVDLAYESSSGDLLVVFADNTATPRYRTRTGGVWSGELVLPLNDGGGANPDPNSGVVHWIELESRPGTDEIALVYADANWDLVAILWDGTQWVTASATTLETSLSLNATQAALVNRVFDAAFEADTGDLLVAWGRNGVTGFWYSTKAAGSNTFAAAAQVAGAPTTTPHFVDLAPEPGGTRIAAVLSDLGATNEHLGLAMWNGTAWVNTGDYDTQIIDANDTATGDFAGGVGWVGESGIAVCVYPDNQSGTIDWARWTAGGGWVVQSDVAVAGKGTTQSVQLVPFVTESKLMLVLSDSNSDLWAATYDGSSWTLTNSATALETSLSSINSMPFWFANQGR